MNELYFSQKKRALKDALSDVLQESLVAAESSRVRSARVRVSEGREGKERGEREREEGKDGREKVYCRTA